MFVVVDGGRACGPTRRETVDRTTEVCLEGRVDKNRTGEDGSGH